MLKGKLLDSLTLGPRRRRRRMLRRLEELDRLDASTAVPLRVRGTWSRRLGVSALAVTVAMSIMGTYAHRQFGVTVSSSGIQLPKRLGAPPVVTSSGSFAYLQTQPSSPEPVAYDPCKPIEYVVNDAAAPPGSDALLLSAVEEISTATGLVFLSAGKSDEVPRSRPSRLSRRPDPVLIAWTTPAEVPALGGRTAGVGGSAAQRHDATGKLRYVSGEVALDAPQLAQILAGPGGPEPVRAIIMHELGHLVGLDHVDDPEELMHSDNVGALGLGPGDRQGLAALGGGDCLH